MIEEQWGEWVLHDGKGCPCVGAYVEITAKGNTTGKVWTERGRAIEGQSWCADDSTVSLITHYRILRPAGLQALIDIAANPAPMPEEIDA